MKLKTLKENVIKLSKGRHPITAEESLSILYDILNVLNVPYRISKKKEIIVTVSGHQKIIAKLSDEFGHLSLEKFVKFI